MKTTNTIFLLLLASAVVTAVVYQQRKADTEFRSAAIPEKVIPAINGSELERIVIRQPGSAEVALTRRDDHWYTDPKKGFEADETAINNAIKLVTEPIQATVVSTNPASLEEYELTENSATTVEFFETNDIRPALSLLLGKNGSSAFSSYVRIPGTEEVLSAKSNLGMAFKRPEGWRKREIFSFPAENATRISVEGTSGTYRLVSSEDKWHLEAPEQGEVHEAAAAGIAQMLANLRASGFADDASTRPLADYGLQPARQTVQVAYDDKSTSPSRPTTATLLLGKPAPGGDEWYAKRADKPDVITIGGHVAEALSPALTTLKMDAAPETPPAEIPPPAEQPAPEAPEAPAADEAPSPPAAAEATTASAAETTAPADGV